MSGLGADEDPGPAIARRALAGPHSLAGLRVTVLGLGRFGGQIGAARFFAERGARVTLSDRLPAAALEPSLAALAGLPLRLGLGGHDEGDVGPGGADLVVVSPAVPDEAPILQALAAAGTPWTTEIALALALLPPARVAAVTGSNGKTTTASMLGRALAAAAAPGGRVLVGGNIGRSLLAEAAAGLGARDRVVVELSSFMLERLDRYRGPWPEVAVVTNLTPNHLDRHKTLQRYREAKLRLVRSLPAWGRAVLGRGDAEAAAFAAASAAPVITFGDDASFDGPGLGVATKAGGGRAMMLRSGDRAGGRAREEEATRTVAALEAQRLPGAHNLLNALAATAAAWALGAAPDRAARAALAFEGLPHRLEVVGERQGVLFVNDSKATTTASAALAVAAYAGRRAPLVWLGGGAPKGEAWEPLAHALAGRAAACVVYGEAAPGLAAALTALPAAVRPAVVRHVLFDDAFRAARRLAVPGGVVLLSPACASYDQFASYEARGDRFRALLGDGRPAAGRARARLPGSPRSAAVDGAPERP